MMSNTSTSTMPILSPSAFDDLEMSDDPNSSNEPMTSEDASASNSSMDNQNTQTKTNGRRSRSQRAGLLFSISHVENRLKRERYADRISGAASIYLAAVLEYLVAEMVELAGGMAEQSRRKRITNRDIFLAIKNDPELAKVCANVTIPEGGAVPFIHESLLQKKRPQRKRRAPENVQSTPSSSMNPLKSILKRKSVDMNNNSLATGKNRLSFSFDETDEE